MFSPAIPPAPRPALRASAGGAALLGLLLVVGALSCTRLVASRVGRALDAQGQVFAAEDDPELVREAIPFGLKTLESLLEASPRDPRLLQAAASGFTQYAYAFLLQEAQMQEDHDPEAARAQTARARRLFERAVAYGFRGLEARRKGVSEALRTDPRAAVATLGREDVPLLYWTGAALALRVSVSKDDMAQVGRLPQAEALLTRALALDPDWNDGAIHEFYLAYEGGRAEGRAEATAHFDRVRALTGNQKLGPLVTWAETVCVQAQDAAGFHARLDEVLAFDADRAPRYRLVNLLAQRRARWLKARAPDLFLEE